MSIDLVIKTLATGVISLTGEIRGCGLEIIT